MTSYAKKITYGPVIKSNLEQLRRMNRAIFPVTYSETFYKNILRAPIALCRLVYLLDVPVGSICCRVEPARETMGTPKRAYLMTVGVLAPYRGKKIGTTMLQYIIDTILTKDDLQDIHSIYLHVQSNNEDAQNFYAKFGFKRSGDVIENYYKRITPRSAVILERVFTAEERQAKRNEKKKLELNTSPTTNAASTDGSSTDDGSNTSKAESTTGGKSPKTDIGSDSIGPVDDEAKGKEKNASVGIQLD
eukprot:g796.t1